MAINPYTLNNLYKNGILDYVPADLLMGSPMGVMTPMTNPYLDMAKQGNLYQTHGVSTDSFHTSFTPAYTPNDYQSVSTGANYGASISSINQSSSYNYNGQANFGGYNTVSIGSKSNAGGLNAFRGYGIGAYNNNGMANAFGYDGSIGSMNTSGGINAFGGFSGGERVFSNGINTATSVINKTPKFILGILSGVIGLTAIATLFKRGKKPSTSSNNFWSKLNPINWFRKK